MKKNQSNSTRQKFTIIPQTDTQTEREFRTSTRIPIDPALAGVGESLELRSVDTTDGMRMITEQNFQMFFFIFIYSNNFFIDKMMTIEVKSAALFSSSCGISLFIICLHSM